MRQDFEQKSASLILPGNYSSTALSRADLINLTDKIWISGIFSSTFFNVALKVLYISNVRRTSECQPTIYATAKRQPEKIHCS